MTRDIGLRFPNLPSFASHPNKRDSNSGGNSSSNLLTFGSSGNFLLSNNQQSITEVASSSTNSTITEEKNESGVRWTVCNFKSTQNFLISKPLSRSSPPLLSPKDDNCKYENKNTSATIPLLGTLSSSLTPNAGLQSQIKNLNEKPNKIIHSNTRSGSAKTKFLTSKSSSGRAGRSFSTSNENY